MTSAENIENLWTTDELLQLKSPNSLYLNEQLNEILDVSQLEVGSLKINKVSIKVGKELKETLGLLKSLAEKKGLQLNTHLAENLLETIKTDPFRLRQIIVNLIENSIKYTEKGEITVITSLSKDNNSIFIDITDTGVGIGRKDQKKIFEAFKQVDPFIIRKSGGSGMGLYLLSRA